MELLFEENTLLNHCKPAHIQLNHSSWQKDLQFSKTSGCAPTKRSSTTLIVVYTSYMPLIRIDEFNGTHTQRSKRSKVTTFSNCQWPPVAC